MPHEGASLLVGSILASAAASKPRDLALTLGRQQATFQEVNAQANRTAHALLQLGVVPGDLVAVWSAISIRQVEVFFATALIGAIFAPLNPELTSGEMTAVLDALDPRLVVVDTDHAELAVSVWPFPDQVCLIGGSDHPVPGPDLDARTVAASASPPQGLAFADTQIQTVFLTSGTTAVPKGVMLSHRTNWLRSFGGSNGSADLAGAGRMCTFPLFHRAGWTLLLEAWQARRAIHLVEKSEGSLIIKTAQRWSAAEMYCIPAVWQRVIEAMGSSERVPSLRQADTGTSAVTTSLLAAIKEKFPGSRTTISYGCNEAHLIARLDDWNLFRRAGTVGLPTPPNEVQLVDGDEIRVRNPYLMTGYIRQPELTASVIRDGWYYTGDIGRCDADGFLTVVGRTNELIRTGGEYVAPAEVEQTLSDCPGIGDFAIIGMPDPNFGEVVCVALARRPDDNQPTLGSLQDHVTGKLAPFKRPRQLVYVEAIPRTPATGKVQRRRLKESILSAMTQTSN
jgi:fatty-acyl-CoA synthase